MKTNNFRSKFIQNEFQIVDSAKEKQAKQQIQP